MGDLLANIATEIRQLDALTFYLIAAATSAFAAYLFWRMVCRYQHARLIENTPTARVRSAAQGYIELTGRAEMMEGPVIVSPLTQRRCVWYAFKIEEKVQEYGGKGRMRSRWRVVREERSDDIFLLIDDTGECAIDPEQAEVITRERRQWHKQDVIPPRRYTEWIIKESESLYAIGLFQSVADVQDQAIRHQVSHKLRQWKQDPNQLLHQYDTDRNGQISETEWQQARQDATLAVKRDIGQQAKMKQLSIMRRSPHKNQPFILSTLPETVLVNQNLRHALAALAGFIVLGTMIVWAFNQRLGS